MLCRLLSRGLGVLLLMDIVFWGLRGALLPSQQWVG
jgi:hypothetical protein